MKITELIIKKYQAKDGEVIVTIRTSSVKRYCVYYPDGGWEWYKESHKDKAFEAAEWYAGGGGIR